MTAAQTIPLHSRKDVYRIYSAPLANSRFRCLSVQDALEHTSHPLAAYDSQIQMHILGFLST